MAIPEAKVKNIRIRNIRDSGDLQKERLVLKVEDATDLGNYAIFRAQTDLSDSSVYSGFLSAFWFPDFSAKAGDLVIVYTKKGTRGEKRNADGSTSHFIYLANTTTLWDDEGVTPVLVEISDWDAFKRNE
jgi:hypothetical protein